MTPLAFLDLFDEFRAPSWDGWRGVARRLGPAVRELYVAAGRGSGKSRFASALASCFAARPWPSAPGERVYVGVFAPDRKQARVTFAYVAGLLHAAPELEALIERETRESIDLRTGVTVEVVTASRAAPRGRTYALAIIEEAAFLPQDDSANPDVELVRAVRPALARVAGSLLAVISSPYARRGVLWRAFERYRPASSRTVDGELLVDPGGEAAGDPSVVLVHAATRELNPTFDPRAIDRARDEDPTGAATEYDAAFRTDVESFVTREAVEACVDPGRVELAPREGVPYLAFVDPSGGRSDAMTLAVGHVEGERVVVDVVRERRAPFVPDAVVEDFAAVLAGYSLRRVVGDRYAGEWPVAAFAKHGVDYAAAPRPKSELYREALPLLNSGRVSLPDDRRLVEQFVGLERRTARGGRDSVDHAPGGHDDIANAAAGLVAVASAVPERRPVGGVLW